MRAVKGSSVAVTSPTFVAADGETPADCTGTPTCTVTREDGTALAAATVTSAGTGTGSYTAAITTTHTAQLDRLALVWTGTADGYVQVYRQTLEVVGGRYVTLPELRAEPGLADTARYDRALLDELRDAIERTVEDYTGVAWCRAYERDHLYGNGRGRLLLSRRRPRALLSVTIDGTAVSTALFDLDEVTGELVYLDNTFDPSSDGAPNVVVAYEHGHDNPDGDLALEVRKWIAHNALRRRVVDSPSDAISETVDGRTVRFSTPDPRAGRPTGSLALDAILNRPGVFSRVPGIG